MEYHGGHQPVHIKQLQALLESHQDYQISSSIARFLTGLPNSQWYSQISSSNSRQLAALLESWQITSSFTRQPSAVLPDSLHHCQRAKNISIQQAPQPDNLHHKHIASSIARQPAVLQDSIARQLAALPDTWYHFQVVNSIVR